MRALAHKLEEVVEFLSLPTTSVPRVRQMQVKELLSRIQGQIETFPPKTVAQLEAKYNIVDHTLDEYAELSSSEHASSSYYIRSSCASATISDPEPADSEPEPGGSHTEQMDPETESGERQSLRSEDSLDTPLSVTESNDT